MTEYASGREKQLASRTASCASGLRPSSSESASESIGHCQCQSLSGMGCMALLVNSTFKVGTNFKLNLKGNLNLNTTSAARTLDRHEKAAPF